MERKKPKSVLTLIPYTPISKLYTKIIHNIPPVTKPTETRLCIPELDKQISPEEVIKTLKNNKTPGPDGIPAEFYKALPERLLNILTAIFNLVFQLGQYPESWAEGLICPIHKSGVKTDPNNYRGITLLNCIGKIFTAEDSKLLPEEQYGFRKNRRAVDCVFILNTVIDKAKADKTPLYVCYVDLKKAFDKVVHHLLWKKLLSLGISDKVLRQSMYVKASACPQIKQP